MSTQNIWNIPEQEFMIANGLCPTEQFMKTFKQLTRMLKHCPDGYLFKFKKTGKEKSLKTALKELDLGNLKRCGGGWTVGGISFNSAKHTEDEQLPIINREIEIVEVKSGKARLFRARKKIIATLSEKKSSIVILKLT